MTNKTPAIISSVLTVILLIVLAVLFSFFQLVALNGASEQQGTTALLVSLLCQGVGIILLGFFASWATNLMIRKFKWNEVIAVILAVGAGLTAGGFLSFVAVIVAITAAGVK